jgi:FkbM family methyltransferase
MSSVIESSFQELSGNDYLTRIERFSLNHGGHSHPIQYAWSRPSDGTTYGQGISEFIEKYSQFVVPHSIAIDIGANDGDTAIPLAVLTQGGPVFAFEPGIQFASQLNINAGLNPSLNIICLPYAVMEKSGVHTFLYSPNDYNGGAAQSNAWVGTYTKPRLVRAVNFVEFFTGKIDFKKISFIKIDTEGHDFHILRSFADVLKTVRPVILAEWFPRTDNLIRQLASDLNYSVFCGFTYEPIIFGISKWRQDVLLIPTERLNQYDLTIRPN